MSPHVIDFTISVVAFLLGGYVLLDKSVETRKLCQAIPILVGMLGWILLALLTASAIYAINLTGRINSQVALWEYVIYRFCMLWVWCDYLRQVKHHFNIPCKKVKL